MKYFVFLVSIIFICLGGNAQTTQLWGVTTKGGQHNAGTIFRTDVNGNNETIEYNFIQTDGTGSGFSSKLTETSNGKYFGMTPNGGPYDKGVLFEYDPVANVYIKRIEFDGANSGAMPFGALIQASDGMLYGMTQLGGVNDMGVLFEYNPITYVYNKLVDFNGTNGAKPKGDLLQAQDGMLYGLTSLGSPGGTIFQFDPVSHALIVKYTSNNFSPDGNVIQALDGKLYGLTKGGGTSGNGTVFQFDLITNTFTKKFDFDGSANGGYPGASLVLASNNMMYGLTYYGGANNKGILFQYDYTANTFSKKYDLSTISGYNCYGSLMKASNGSLYGVTGNGGTVGVGVLFEYNPATNMYTKKIDFDGTNGAQPYSTIMQASTGKFYGITNNGGLNNLGVIFEYDGNANMSAKKIDFGEAPGGKGPQGKLLRAKDGLLYGVTATGGVHNHGTIFRYDPVNHLHTKVYDFDSINGYYNGTSYTSFRSLTEGIDGKLYGVTNYGGVNNKGVIYQIDPISLVYTKKYDFTTSTNGVIPVGTLRQTVSGIFYGLANGGSTNDGVIYKFDPVSNVYTKCLDFYSSSIGSQPQEIFLANDTTIYGVCYSGGANGRGTLFQYGFGQNVFIAKKYDFPPYLTTWGGSRPYSIMVGSDGKVYGTTMEGGANYYGGLFQYNPSNNIVQHYGFFNGSTTGNYTRGNLMEATNGMMYGFNEQGGVNGYGVMYQSNPGNYSSTNKINFNGANGNFPWHSSLIEVGDTIITKPVITNICAGNKINVPYAMVGNFLSGNNFNVQLSDASGSFSSPMTLGSFTTPLIGSTNVIVPLGTSPGNGYRVRIVSTNPIMIGNDNGTNISINAFISPTVSVSNGTICAGKVFTMTPSGCVSYTYSSGTATVNPIHDTTYSIIGVDMYGCLDTAICSIHVNSNPTVTAVSSQSVLCPGGTATLTAMGAINYTWTPGAVYSSTAVVTPTASGFYYAKGENSFGCSTTANVYLWISNPIITATSNPTVVCAGSNATLSASGVSSYTWSPGAITSNSIVVTPTATVIYTVNGTSSEGCVVTKTISLSYTSSVSATSSAYSLCPGSSATLTGSGASTYTWYPMFSNTGSVVVTPTTSTTYTLSGKTGSCTSSQTIGIVYNPPASFTSVATPTALCLGQTATLSVIGAVTYTCSGYTPQYPLVVKPTTSSSTFYLTGTAANGCTGTSSISVLTDVSSYFTVSASNTVCSGSPDINGNWGKIILYYSNPSLTHTLSPAGATVMNPTLTLIAPLVNTTYTIAASSATCSWRDSVYVTVIPLPVVSLSTSGTITCVPGSTAQAVATVTGPVNYTWQGPYSMANIHNPTLIVSQAGTYSCYVNSPVTGCYAVPTPTCLVSGNQTPPIISIALSASGPICQGSSATISASGADTYTWSTGAISNNINVLPSSNTLYSVTGTDSYSCSSTKTVNVMIDNTCADVWPGDANSDGSANNLDVLELGLHFNQTGTPRSFVSNNWQSYFATNWTGTITNGGNLNHSDCNGDGTVNDNDTLAIYNNYGLTHAFKASNTGAVNPQLSIVPDQPMVVKGTWGTASVYLGDAGMHVNDINGIAFTVDFDNTLIEPNSIYVEYESSFMDAGQNLYFRKLDFDNSKIYTASTHTVNNNVSGFGKIATLHYQIESSLSNDYVLNLGISQANQSDALGTITPLTSGTATLMAIGASVGVKENTIAGNLSIHPNPTNGNVNIISTIDLQGIEVTTTTGQLVMKDTCYSKTHQLQLQNLAEGIYFVRVSFANGSSVVRKVVKQ